MLYNSLVANGQIVSIMHCFLKEIPLMVQLGHNCIADLKYKKKTRPKCNEYTLYSTSSCTSDGKTWIINCESISYSTINLYKLLGFISIVNVICLKVIITVL